MSDRSHYSPFREDEIAAVHKAIKKSGRTIVLSLSPGPAPPEQYETLRKYALWRISSYLWGPLAGEDLHCS